MEKRGPDAVHFRITHPKEIIHIFQGYFPVQELCVVTFYLSAGHCRASGGLLQDP